ncbi:hypothetical protein Sango_1339900 [Sesamum angolense]|uniref:WW domain-containing protein n=1 Tax=Sesamum angolense TaxID=2727404 RepID=A0AAE2BUV4_9LAMI|nr:hypothetical protein Sango_1339900 [Sesamum angolense]
MGRRKERRLAAISAAGRRVKLDLFAEPSGDLGGSSAQEEVGGDDAKTHAELPSSPTSSGQQNPLLLLEQYSDEELDEGSNEGHNHAVAEDTSNDIDEEANSAAGKETEDSGNNYGKEPTTQKTDQSLMNDSSQDPLHKGEKGSIAEIDSDDLPRQTNKMEEATCPAAPDAHLVGDVSSGWKMVLHEESNQYYYWNTVTGETSWEVPDVLSQETVTTPVEKILDDNEGKMKALMGAQKSSVALDMEEDDTGKLNLDSKVNCQSNDTVDLGTQLDGSNEGFKGDSVDDVEGNRDANQRDETSLLISHSVENRSGADLSSRLIKCCERLLERLNSLKGLNCYLEGQDVKLKCTWEIQTRLADIKALASHGSSLLHFWLHSEEQLKRLEAAVDGVIQCHSSSSLSGLEGTLESSEDIGDGTETDSGEKKVLLAALESDAEYRDKKSNFEALSDGAAAMGHVPSKPCSSTYPVNNVGGKSDMIETEKESELMPNPALHSCEDVDMDVDMEVEDAPSIRPPHESASGAHFHVSTELSDRHDRLSDQESKVPGQVFAVPLPVEEWIPPPPPDSEPFPPPPPDDEPFPPPPPDEPPETSYPPSSHLGSVQPVHPFPYSAQYTLSYPGSSLEYYGQPNLEIPGTTLYTHPEGGQVAVAHVQHYYEAAPNLYAVAPLVVNPVESTAYYGLQNESLNPVSLISGAAQSSGIHSEPVAEIPDSGTAGSLDSHTGAGSNLLLKNSATDANPGHATVAPSEVHDAQPSVGAPATSLLTNSGSVSSTSDTTTSVSAAAAAAAAAAATSKAQSKVPRGKKRTVAVVSTLRSNKKVSSLVDKWKAAKEELHEEEEEPEDAYEILEKKRQREIEEWRAQQIASGEAKDNANFQPLGGDWRERVKRKRAEKRKEAEQSSSDVAAAGNQQPDLGELSKGLPSGWQVYWDESSKQVYYGNVWTSETTWSRPTD